MPRGGTPGPSGPIIDPRQLPRKPGGMGPIIGGPRSPRNGGQMAQNNLAEIARKRLAKMG